MNVQRELNPQLFGGPQAGQDTPRPASDNRSAAASVMGSPEEVSRRAVPYPPVDLKAMETQMTSVRGALLQMEKRTETIAFKMEELARTVHARLERFSQAIIRFEENQSKLAQDSNAKFASVVGKVNERRMNDGKIQELVDRHNTIIRNFENRLTSMQRLISEQEMSLHNAQAALEDARSEMARGRR